MVASNALAPITDAEAGALGPAHDLLQKASAVLTAVHGALGNTLSAETAERMTWKNVEYLNAAAANVRSSGRFVTSGGPAHYGLLSEDGIAYWYVELRPSRRSTTRDEAVLNAAAGLSTDLWERGIAGSAILHARARATGFDSHAQAVEWILARLLDLDASGAFGAAE